ncbi:hypothetical protein [Pontibacter vulgaris]|uniref:hypothetical protein n=1 Tax=Pontibacter vulgaris TaxID=2905679 RepID=UPI001FA71892|nr:hypothetical protein [Pontibacter vulgaris]
MRHLTLLKFPVLALAILCLLLLSVAAKAQTDSTSAQTDTTAQTGVGKRWVIETKDGSVIQGRFMGQTEAGIKLMTESAGEVLIPNNQIRSAKVLDEAKFRKGVYWFENPNSSRYLFGPSAFSLRKGEAYYQNTYLVLNSFSYGVTNNFTIGGGFELISTFTGNPIVFLTPKYSFPITEKLRAGAGVFYANAIGTSDNFSGLGIGYGLVTYGNTDDNATVGLGYGFVDEEFSSQPVITISGMKRVSRKVGLVTENWIVPADGSYGIFSYGMRFMGEKITVDLAFLNNADIASEIPIGVPYVDFVIKFGK